MMGNRLSNKLNNLGFFAALGTTECVCTPSQSVVDRREPFHYDTNNGILVVYDEEGRPWLIRNDSDGKKKLEVLNAEHNLKRGVYVPHSNDGGWFFREVISKI